RPSRRLVHKLELLRALRPKTRRPEPFEKRFSLFPPDAHRPRRCKVFGRRASQFAANDFCLTYREIPAERKKQPQDTTAETTATPPGFVTSVSIAGCLAIRVVI